MPTSDRFVDAYESTPPWDVGKAQPPLVALFDALKLTSGSALDVGCGTGENVLNLAARGVEAWGLDATPKAIELARAKASERGLTANFVVGDALDLQALGRTFDLVVDCGLFHVLDDKERLRYVAQLRHVLPSGGLHLMLGFDFREVETGPRGYTPDELGVFFGGWTKRVMQAVSFAVNNDMHKDRGAWLSVFERP